MAMDRQHAVVKVAFDYEVEQLTRQGWRLREVLQETAVESFNESVQMLVPGNTYPQSFSQTKGFPVTKNRYLMVQDGNKALAEMQAKLDEQQTIVSNAQNMQAEAEKKAAALVKEIEALNYSNGNLIRNAGDTNGQLSKSKELNRKLEGDIAKIRNAIGELKMKEILAT